jgi:hypothetical protein
VPSTESAKLSVVGFVNIRNGHYCQQVVLRAAKRDVAIKLDPGKIAGR